MIQSSLRSLSMLTVLILATFTEISLSAPQNPNPDTSTRTQIFAKRKDIQIEQSESDKENTVARDEAYPTGRHPSIFASGIEGEYYKVVHPILGRVKVADFYKIEDLLALDVKKIMKSDDDWLKYVCARALYKNDDLWEAYDLLKTITSKFADSYEVRLLRSDIKMELNIFDSALLDIAPLMKTERDSTQTKTSSLRLTRAQVLIDTGRYEEALQELAIGFEISGTKDVELVFYRAKCNYMLRRYDQIVFELIEEFEEPVPLKSLGQLWIGSRAMVKKQQPLYDNALKHLDSSRFENSMIEFVTKLDASFIHSCRPDKDRRNGKRALELLDSLRGHRYYDYYVKSFIMAEALTNLELGEFDRASECLEKLKSMLVSEWDFPDLREIEAAIRNKRPYIPAKQIPLSLDSHI